MKPLTAREILMTNIGGKRLEELLLENAGAPSGASPLKTWSTNKLYELLAKDGLVVEAEHENRCFRRWRLTEEGKQRLQNAGAPAI